MEFDVKKDGNKKALELSEIISYGGSSSDTEPLNVRNLLMLSINPKGPVTKQNIAFALENIIRQMPKPYDELLTRHLKKNPEQIRNEFTLIPLISIKEQLRIALQEGTVLDERGFFSISSKYNAEEFTRDFFEYLNGKFLCAGLYNILSVKHCWNKNLLFITKKKAALFSWFSYD